MNLSENSSNILRGQTKKENLEPMLNRKFKEVYSYLLLTLPHISCSMAAVYIPLCSPFIFLFTHLVQSGETSYLPFI